MESPENVLDQIFAQAGQRMDSLRVGNRIVEPEEVIRILRPHMSDERIHRIHRVVASRTYGVIPVVEGVVNTGNVSAVMRTSEALGFQEFHVVAGPKPAPVKESARAAQGAQKWLDVFMWDSANSCAKTLKKDGYRVVVTHLDPSATPITHIDFSQKTALVFGNELSGVSQEMVDAADELCTIAIHGFTESFNISVAAALALYQARSSRFGQSDVMEGDLTEIEQMRLTADFCIRSVRHAQQIVERAVASTHRM